MRTYTYRPYFAHDCDSDMGFNNGYYLDEITITAPDDETARARALEALSDRFDLETVDADETALLDVDAAWTRGHVWRRGNEETEMEPIDDENGDWGVSYLYQYLDLGEPEVSDSIDIND